MAAFATANGTVGTSSPAASSGATPILLYTSSTITAFRSRALPFLRTLDHAAIFLLIVGTYTPFMLVNLRAVWVEPLGDLVAGGRHRALRLSCAGCRHRLVVGIYVAMVGLSSSPCSRCWQTLPLAACPVCRRWRLAYTAGVAFTGGAARFHHAIWHRFRAARRAALLRRSFSTSFPGRRTDRPEARFRRGVIRLPLLSTQFPSQAAMTNSSQEAATSAADPPLTPLPLFRQLRRILPPACSLL